MNKIYRIIWNKALNAWVVVAEIARAQGKSTSKTVLSTVILSAGLFAGTTALAANLDETKQQQAGAKQSQCLNADAAKTGNCITETPLTPSISSNWLRDGETATTSPNGTGASTSVHLGSGSDASGEYSIAIGTHNSNNTLPTTASGTNSTAIGVSAVATGRNSIALGNHSKAGTTVNDVDGGLNAIAIGTNAQTSKKDGVALGSYSMADRAKGTATGVTGFGYSLLTPQAGTQEVEGDWDTTPETGDNPIGSAEQKANVTWQSTAAAVSVGNPNGQLTRQIIGVAAGSEDTDAVNVAQLKTVANTVAKGLDSNAGFDASGNWTPPKYKISGNSTEFNDVKSVLTALDTKVDGNKTHYFSVKDTSATPSSNGNYNNEGATADGAIAIGKGAASKGINSAVIGNKSQANGAYSVALGSSALAKAANATAIGSNSSATTNSVALGSKAVATGQKAVALGANTMVTNSNGGVALGFNSVADRDVSSPEDGDAMDTDSTDLSIGYDPLGETHTSSDPGEASIWKATRAAVSVGNSDKNETRQIINVAAGSEDSDAVNVAQLKSTLQAAKQTIANTVGGGADINTNYDDQGKGDGIWKAPSYVISGVNNNDPFHNVGDALTALDNKVNENAIHYVSINDNGTTGDNHDNQGATGTNAIAIGVGAAANATNGLALGSAAHANAVNGISIGNGTDVAANGVALGAGAKVTVEGGVALGNNSVADETVGQIGYDPLTGIASTTDNLTWKANAGAVSVGSNGATTRQITNVAAGSGDTDAVNVAQLKQAVTYTDQVQNQVTNVQNQVTNLGTQVNNLGTSVATALGGEAKYENGVWTAPKYKLSGTGSGSGDNNDTYTDVGSALNALNSKVDSNKTHYFAVNPEDNNSSTTEGNYYNNGATGSGSVAIGSGAIANSQDPDIDIPIAATAVGWNAQALGSGATAYGANANAAGYNSVAIGNQANVQFSESVAIGSQSQVHSSEAVAIGFQSEANLLSSVALGYKAHATQEDSVALGAGSVTDAHLGDTSYHINNDADLSSPIWRPTDGVVSIGRDAYTDKNGEKMAAISRRISHVAAGAEDADAVNVAQLKSLAKVTADALGGGANANADGNWKWQDPSYTISDTTDGINGGNTYNNVGSALAALDGKVDKNKTHYFGVNGNNDINDINYDGGGAQGAGSVAIGVSAQATVDDGVALGSNSVASTAKMWSVMTSWLLVQTTLRVPVPTPMRHGNLLLVQYQQVVMV